MRELSIREKMTKRVFFQSAVLGLTGGPVMWALHGFESIGFLAWAIFAMAAAPFIVEALRPTFVRTNDV